jgi:hypothetical protein
MIKKKVKSFFKDLFKKKDKVVKKDSSQKLITKKNNAIVKKNNTDVKKQSTEVVKKRPNSVNKNKKNNNLRDLGIGAGIALAGTAANKMFSDDSSSSARKNNNPGTGNEIKSKKNFGMGGVDSFSKSKVKQGPPKPPKKAPIKKKKSKSNISNSSSYDADFTKKGLEKRGLSPKASMSKENIAKTTAAKNKKNAAGQDFGAKKKKKVIPIAESDGGKIKMSKGYSAGGKIFTGR